MITIAAKDERIAKLLRCGSPKLLMLHFETEREPGQWAIHRFWIAFGRHEEPYPLITGSLVFTAGENQGISATMGEARLFLGEEECEVIEDEDTRDAIALAALLYIAGDRLMEVKKTQEAKRAVLETLHQLEGKSEENRETKGP